MDTNLARILSLIGLQLRLRLLLLVVGPPLLRYSSSTFALASASRSDGFDVGDRILQKGKKSTKEKETKDRGLHGASNDGWVLLPGFTPKRSLHSQWRDQIAWAFLP